jgi:hypothetical protein
VFAEHKCNAVLIEYVDSHWAKAISEVIDAMAHRTDINVADDTEQNAIFMISEMLGGKVIGK